MDVLAKNVDEYIRDGESLRQRGDVGRDEVPPRFDREQAARASRSAAASRGGPSGDSSSSLTSSCSGSLRVRLGEEQPDAVQEHAGDRLVIAFAVAVHPADALIVARMRPGSASSMSISGRRVSKSGGGREMGLVGPFGLRQGACEQALADCGRSRRRVEQAWFDSRSCRISSLRGAKRRGNPASVTGCFAMVAMTLGLPLVGWRCAAFGPDWRTPSSTWSANSAKLSTNRSTSLAAVRS